MGTPPPEALETAELLAAVLDPEGPDTAGHELLAAAGDLGRLLRLTPAELVPLVGAAAARRVACALELGRRAARPALSSRQAVRGLADVEPHLRGMLGGRLKEVFVVLLLDAKNRPLRSERVSEGCLTWSVVHPREVFAPAVRESAGAIIVAHNHPSGDPTPSAQDVEVTARLVRAGETLGIPLLDHVIVGAGRSLSMRAQGLLDGGGG